MNTTRCEVHGAVLATIWEGSEPMCEGCYEDAMHPACEVCHSRYCPEAHGTEAVCRPCFEETVNGGNYN